MDNTAVETEIPEHKLILSRTDSEGKITYVNDTFSQICGYQAKEMIGRQHNMIRHPDMPRSVFKQMWEMLLNGKPWQGYIKNLRKDGGFYWVNAKIEPLYEHSKLIGYKSMRSYVSPLKRHEMEHKYSTIALAEEEIIQFTTRLTKETWTKLCAYAEKKEMTHREAIEEIVSEVLK